MICKSGNRVFNESFAKEYGLAHAVMFDYIYSWCVKNFRDGINQHDGAFWTYDSYVDISERLGYLTPAQVKKCILDLEKQGLIESGNYNKNHYDKTKWYTISEYGFEILEKCSKEPVVNMNKGRKNAKNKNVTKLQNEQLNIEEKTVQWSLNDNRVVTDSKPIPITKPITKTNHSSSSQGSDLLKQEWVSQEWVSQESLSEEESIKYFLESKNLDDTLIQIEIEEESESLTNLESNKNLVAESQVETYVEEINIDSELVDRAEQYFKTVTEQEINDIDSVPILNYYSKSQPSYNIPFGFQNRNIINSVCSLGRSIK